MAIRKRGKKTYQVTVFLPPGSRPGVKRPRVTITVHGTRKDAENAEERLRERVRKGAIVPGADNLPLNEYLDRWMEEHVRSLRRPTTAAGYETHLRPVREALGHIRLGRLQPLQIQGFLASQLQEGKSARTVRHYHAVLHSALEQAVKWQMLPDNPAARVTLPAVDAEEPAVIAPRDLARLLRAAKEHDPQDATMYLLAAACGLRRSELLGLKWEDVDFDAGQIHVRRGLHRVAGQGYVETGNKSRRSRRVIAIPQVAVRELKQHRAHMAEIRLLAGAAFEDQGLVFCRPDGKPLDPTGVTKRFKTLVRRLGLDERITLHTLRHSQASVLLMAGVPVRVVQDRLGHSTASLTLDVYGHLLPGAQEAAAAAFDRAMEAAGFDAGGDSHGVTLASYRRQNTRTGRENMHSPERRKR